MFTFTAAALFADQSHCTDRTHCNLMLQAPPYLTPKLWQEGWWRWRHLWRVFDWHLVRVWCWRRRAACLDPCSRLWLTKAHFDTQTVGLFHGYQYLEAWWVMVTVAQNVCDAQAVAQLVCWCSRLDALASKVEWQWWWRCRGGGRWCDTRVRCRRGACQQPSCELLTASPTSVQVKWGLQPVFANTLYWLFDTNFNLTIATSSQTSLWLQQCECWWWRLNLTSICNCCVLPCSKFLLMSIELVDLVSWLHPANSWLIDWPVFLACVIEIVCSKCLLLNAQRFFDEAC